MMWHKIKFGKFLLVFVIILSLFWLGCSSSEDDDGDKKETGFSVTTTSPTNGATEISQSTNIKITFNRVVDSSTLSDNTADTQCTGTLKVSNDDFNTCAMMTEQPAVDSTGKIVTLNPDGLLKGETTYKIKVESTVTDTSGDTLKSSYESGSGFVTEVDGTAPEIISIEPADESTDVSVDVDMTLTFNEAMDPNSLTVNNSGSSCSGTIQLSHDDFSTCYTFMSDTASKQTDRIFTLSASLAAHTDYRLKITTSATDLTGNALASDFETATGFSTEYVKALADTTSELNTVAGGYSHSCFILSDQTVQCVGMNYYGQLGDGTTTSSSSPVTVSDLSGVTQISAGTYHTCALLSSGSIKCWGNNTYGKLGDGTTTDSSTPVTVSGISTAEFISTSYENTCAVLSSGKVNCWGRGNSGELGNGSNSYSYTPVEVSTITLASQVAVGQQFACALLTDGTVWCWGKGTVLGDGTTTASNVPVQVLGIGGTGNLTNAFQLACGSGHSCALLTDKTIACWGMNDEGQLGNGTTTTSTYPVAVSDISTGNETADGMKISAGHEFSCAVLNDDTVKCWGAADYSQLGNGSYTSSSTPVTVDGLSDAQDINLGHTHGLSVISDGAIVCWGSSPNAVCGSGAAIDTLTYMAP